MDGQRDLTIAFGPVGLAGWALLLLGILKRRRVLALLGLGAVSLPAAIAAWAV